MSQRSITIRFYLAQKAPATPPFAWPSDQLRALLRARLPAAGADGRAVSINGETFLVEQATGSSHVVHAMVSVDMDQVPSVRVGSHTDVLTLTANQVPAMTTHMLFFPCGVVGVIRPTLTAAMPHVSSNAITRTTGVPLGISALVREDQLTVLNQALGVSTFEITVTDIAPDLADVDGTYAAARALQGTHLEGTIRLVARSNADKRRLLQRAREALENVRSGRLELKHARVTASGGPGVRPRVIDLLEDEIVERVTVQLTQVGPLATLTAAQVFDAATTAYNGLDTVLGAALASTPSEFAQDR